MDCSFVYIIPVKINKRSTQRLTTVLCNQNSLFLCGILTTLCKQTYLQNYTSQPYDKILCNQTLFQVLWLLQQQSSELYSEDLYRPSYNCGIDIQSVLQIQCHVLNCVHVFMFKKYFVFSNQSHFSGIQGQRVNKIWYVDKLTIENQTFCGQK